MAARDRPLVLQLRLLAAARKPISYTSYATQAGSVAFQLQLAEAAMRIDTAHLHAYRAIDVLLSAHGAGSFAEVNPLLRIRRDDRITPLIRPGGNSS